MSYVKPHFIDDSKATNIISGKQIAKYDRNKAKLSDILLSDGTSLVDFHLNMCNQVLPDTLVYDITPFFNGHCAKDYYAAHLALTCIQNVLLENYHDSATPEKTKQIRDNIFMPAFEKVEKYFGMKPLMFRLPWGDDFDKYVNNKDVADNLINGFIGDLTR